MADEADKDMQRLENAAAALAEHFDTVQIVATRHVPSEGGTVVCHSGRGNWYARVGSTKEWLIRCDERSREEIRHKDED